MEIKVKVGGENKGRNREMRKTVKVREKAGRKGGRERMEGVRI